MFIRTHHTSKTRDGRRYWRAVVQGDAGYDHPAYVEIEQAVGADTWLRYTFEVTTHEGSSYRGFANNLKTAVYNSAHYAAHVVNPNSRNPYTR